MKKGESLMQFPCDFTLKIIGINHAEFFTQVKVIVKKHFPTCQEHAMHISPSKHGNYLAISVTVLATCQKTLDALYQELTRHKDIKMVL